MEQNTEKEGTSHPLPSSQPVLTLPTARASPRAAHREHSPGEQAHPIGTHPALCCYFSFNNPSGSDGKASAYNTGDPGSIPGLENSPGEGNGNPLQYSCLENPMDGEAW